MFNRIGWGAWMVSTAVHALVLTCVWVGFSVSISRQSVGFYYTGPSLPVQGMYALTPVDRVVQGAAAGPYTAADFVPWINMRDVNKPR